MQTAVGLFICSEGKIPSLNNPRCKPAKRRLSSSPGTVDIDTSNIGRVACIEIQEDRGRLEFQHVGMWWRFDGDDPRVRLWVDSLERQYEWDAVEWPITNLPETPEKALQRFQAESPWIFSPRERENLLKAYAEFLHIFAATAPRNPRHHGLR